MLLHMEEAEKESDTDQRLSLVIVLFLGQHRYVSCYSIRNENYNSAHKNSCLQKFHVVRGKQTEITNAFSEV